MKRFKQFLTEGEVTEMNEKEILYTENNPLTTANTNSVINKSLSCLKPFIIVLNIFVFIIIS